EEVVAAVVVLADDAAVLLLGVDRHLGQKVRERPLDVRVGQPKRHGFVASVEELLPLFLQDIELAVDVRLVNVRDWDLFARPFSAETGVFEDYKITYGISAHSGRAAY